MVCVPCFIIPVLLYVWHRWLQPIMLRYWNPWAVRDADGNITDNSTPAFPFQCAGGQCPFPGVKGAKPIDAAADGAGAAADDATTTVAAATTTTTAAATDEAQATPVGDKKRD